MPGVEEASEISYSGCEQDPALKDVVHAGMRAVLLESDVDAAQAVNRRRQLYELTDEEWHNRVTSTDHSNL